MKIKILHLYPDLLNLYGDREISNVCENDLCGAVLTRRL